MMVSIIPPGEVLRAKETSDASPEGPPKSPSRKPKASSDRFSSINAFVDITMKGLTRAEALVWVTLWRDTRNGLARPSMGYLARRVGCDRRTICRALRELCRRGLVELVRRGAKGGGTNVYRLRAEEKST